MLAERDVRSDLLALGLLVLVIFLGLALVTYDPADPIVELVYPLNQLYQADQLIYPPNSVPTNMCGPWGALAASMLFEAIGVGAYYAVATLASITLLMLLRADLDSFALRAVGWFFSLLGLCTLAQMIAPALTPGPVIGAGGYLGALVSGLLKVHFAFVGGLVLAASVLLAGLLLCTDYVLVHVGLMLGTMTLVGFSRSGELLMRARPWRTDQTEVPRSKLSVRVQGRRVHVASSNEEDQADDDGSDEDHRVVPLRLAGQPVDSTQLDDEDVDDEESDEVDEDEADVADQESQPAPSPLLRATRGRRRFSLFRGASEPKAVERDQVMQQLDQASESDDPSEYELPSLELLQPSDDFSVDDQAKEVQRKAKILEQTFESFGFNVKVVEIETGPVIAQYEVALEAGLRLSKITGLADDLAIALRVPSVRIVAPIPGKNTVGIEVPNEERQLVRLREVMEQGAQRIKKMRIPIFLGKDVSGNPLTVDLSAMPHLLIAGRTGTGKSVCLNAIIASILMTRRPDEVRMLMIDPKMVELSGYKSLPHLMHPVVTDMRKAEAILAWAVEKMEERYELLARAGVRHISSYNQLSEAEIMNRVAPASEEERQAIPLHMPFIVIVADEIADLMMTAGKEVEQHIIRLAQKSRAVGIHLILATQKPTVDVITGLIKSNLPARIAFQVSSRTDSRVVLDEMGADKLLGNGDMLFLWPGTSTLIRGQGTYLSDDEINAVVQAVSTGEQHFVNELVELKVNDDKEEAPKALKHSDELYDDAIEVVIREGRGSVSLLQRALGIGYGRAARLIDFMAEDGIVGEYAGSQAREVLLSMAEWERWKTEGGQKAKEEDLAVNAKKPVAKKDDDGTVLKVHARHGKASEEELEVEDEDLDDEEWDDAEMEEYEDVDVIS